VCDLVWIAFVVILCSGCALLPGGDGGGLGSLLPTSDLGVSATLAFPAVGTLDTGAFLAKPVARGKILDQDGRAVAGVVICYGTGEADAVLVAETDTQGSYSASLSASGEGSAHLLWPYLPLYRFEPDRVQVQGYLLGESTVDSVAAPSIYPVPPERDCR
jgi:hypothetical protein